MNKSLKAKNLPLFSIIDLDQLRRENHLEGTEVTDFFTARDGKVYLLMEQPSETQGKDWLSIPSTYTAVEIQLDWAEQRVLETTLFPLGLLKFQFHYLRPAGEHFLLLGARCAYRENGPDQNAWIVSRDGAVLSRFCLGDGIQDCVVKKDGTIITSYFDEGVFGNYGWDEPLGACGLIAWTSEGTPLWKNEKYSIYDCYAISLDEEENLWFYYYDEFRLVRTNFKEDFVFELPIEGSGAFSVAPSGNTFLFQGGYQQRDKFYFLTAHGDRLGQKQEAIPTCDGNKVAVSSAAYFAARCCSSGKTVFSMEVFWGAMAYETDRYLYGGSDLSAVDFTDRPPGIQKLDRLAGAGHSGLEPAAGGCPPSSGIRRYGLVQRPASMRGNHDYIFDFLKSVCYAFGHLYGKREGISPEALMEECLHDVEQAAYHPHKALNQAIAQHLMQGDLQENLDRL